MGEGEEGDFGLLFTKICVLINIMAFSSGEGGWKLAALPRPIFPAPPPSPVPYPGYCTRLTCPILPTDNLNNRKPPPTPLRKIKTRRRRNSSPLPSFPPLAHPRPPLFSPPAREAIWWVGGRLRLVSPLAASLPLMLMPPIFTLLLLLLLLSLQRGHFFLSPLPFVMSDTRFCCAAAVLC